MGLSRVARQMVQAYRSLTSDAMTMGCFGYIVLGGGPINFDSKLIGDSV